MATIQRECHYDDIKKEIGNDKFVIWGTTQWAHIFYLYCLEAGLTEQIEAFVVSDLARVRNRKICKLHGIRICSLEEWESALSAKKGFIAARDEVIEKELASLLKSISSEMIWYCCDDIVDLHFRQLYAAQGMLFISGLGNHLAYTNQEAGNYNIWTEQKQQYYRYLPRYGRGVRPDIEIFNKTRTIDELYEDQLGSYECITEVAQACVSGKTCSIYMARSHMDRALAEEMETPFVVPLQCGAALTTSEVESLKDNTGDNISLRNRDYCEMTGVYWAWKNDLSSDYIGLCHYRRRYDVDRSIIEYAMEKEYDILTTIPKLTDGGMREEFVERNYFLTPEMWELTENAIRELFPEYLGSWLEFDHSKFLLPFNMAIMKRSVFEEYCSIIFPILEKVDAYYIKQGIQRNDRYLGYISECFLTVFVMRNKNRFKKAYVEVKVLACKN